MSTVDLGGNMSTIKGLLDVYGPHAQLGDIMRDLGSRRVKKNLVLLLLRNHGGHHGGRPAAGLETQRQRLGVRGLPWPQAPGPASKGDEHQGGRLMARRDFIPKSEVVRIKREMATHRLIKTRAGNKEAADDYLFAMNIVAEIIRDMK